MYIHAGYTVILAINQTLTSASFICSHAVLSYWAWLLLNNLCSIFHVTQLQLLVVLYFWGVWLHYPSTKQSKYSNCTVNLKEIQTFHHHRQTHLINPFNQHQTPDTRHDPMQNPGLTQIFYKVGQTQTKRNLGDPDDPTRFKLWRSNKIVHKNNWSLTENHNRVTVAVFYTQHFSILVTIYTNTYGKNRLITEPLMSKLWWIDHRFHRRNKQKV